MLGTHIKTAVTTLRRSKWRSILTMLGVIIGVASVVTAVSLGEGVKRQVTSQIARLGPDVITVLPGQAGASQSAVSINNRSGKSFTEKDLVTIAHTPGVHLAVPLAVLSSVADNNGKAYDGPVIATSGDLQQVFGQDILYGSFFPADTTDKDVAVVGQAVAENLYGENVPIGKSFSIRGETLRIRGIFQEFDTSPLTPGIDYNQAIFIPYDLAKKLNGATVPIYEILVKPTDINQVDQVAEDVKRTLLAAHGGTQDFAVLRQQQSLATASDVFNILTALVASIAAISLLVGGIGIMNIMLLSVSERYHEIGIRKAVGATNQQILSQFLTEASLLSFTGGVIGVLVAMLANYFMRVLTDLKPVITWQISLLAVVLAMIVGIIFGVIPAMRAAQKDPIDALRHE